VNRIPLVDLALQHLEVKDEVELGFDQVLARGDYIAGAAVAAFEQEYARYTGVRHCVGVGNGTDALEIALRSAGIRAGDEVILPANTFIATAEAVVRVGAQPVLVDVDEAALLMDPALVEEAVTARTRAVMPVHLYGQCAPVERLPAVLREREIVIVEDAAQSQGARRFGRPAGTLGAVAGTSFYPGKNLGAYGDAGAVLTEDAELAHRARLMGAHGSESKYQHTIFGFNSRLDTLQAVVLRAKLKRLDGWNAARAAAAQRYRALLEGIEGVRVPATLEGNEHVWHLFVVRVDHRDEVLRRLNEAGVGAAIHYPLPVHRQAAFADLHLDKGDYPVTDASAGRILSLPLYPGITGDQQEQVIAALRSALH
jgi:dTDP-4-amino-4,6-dideoxygalactose transaminase